MATSLHLGEEHEAPGKLEPPTVAALAALPLQNPEKILFCSLNPSQSSSRLLKHPIPSISKVSSLHDWGVDSGLQAEPLCAKELER